MEAMKNDGWILCTERLPEEKESVFVKWKGTDRWRNGMFEAKSDSVDVTLEYPGGYRCTDTGYTVDGKWKTRLGCVDKGRVIAWQPKRAPYKGPEGGKAS